MLCQQGLQCSVSVERDFSSPLCLGGACFLPLAPCVLCVGTHTRAGSPPPGVHPSPDGADVAAPVSIIEWFLNFYDEARQSKVGQTLTRGWRHCCVRIYIPLLIRRMHPSMHPSPSCCEPGACPVNVLVLLGPAH